MNFDAMEYYSQLEDFFNEKQQNEIYDIFSSLHFKSNKNFYHFSNIKKILDDSDILSKENYYSEVHMPIYYEVESFFVSLRSTVDVMLHLINYIYSMNVEKNDVNLYTIYHHKKLPNGVKNIFKRYTRPYNNPTWNFIYTSRNEIVHHKSVNQIIPINIDLFSYEKPMVFFEWEDGEKEMIAFFTQCLSFLENFSSQSLQSIKVSLLK